MRGLKTIFVNNIIVITWKIRCYIKHFRGLVFNDNLEKMWNTVASSFGITDILVTVHFKDVK